MIEHLLEWCNKHSRLSDICKKRIDQCSIDLSASCIKHCSRRIETEDNFIEHISSYHRNKNSPLISKFLSSPLFEKMIQKYCCNGNYSGKHYSFIPYHARKKSYTYKRTKHPYIFRMIIIDTQKLINKIKYKDKK